MKLCAKCNKKIQTKIYIDGETKYITTKHRKYCLDCSPFNNKRHFIGSDTEYEKVCRTCKEKLPRKEFYRIGKNTPNVEPNCKKCAREKNNANNRMLKQKLVEYKGGKCENCGYNKCIAALEFHHQDPLQKEFTISNKGKYTYEKLLKEADKCLLLCSNCHQEIHYGY